MNILFLSEMYYPQGGGAELATHLYARLLSREGFNVIVVTNRFDGEAELSKNERLTVYRLPLFKGTGSVKYSILTRVDVLFSHFIGKLMKWADVVYVPRYWFSAILLAKAHRRPVVTHLHDYIPICSLSNLFDVSKNTVCDKRALCSTRCIYAYEKAGTRGLGPVLGSTLLNSTLGWYFGKAATLSDAIVCASKAQRNLIIKRHADLASKTHVIYNPLPEVLPRKAKGEDFGYFGGPSYMKGFQVLYKAAAHIYQVRHKKLRIQATKFSGISARFTSDLSKLGIVAHGRLSSEDYATLNDGIRTVIVPSVWEEPLPYVVTEAMLSGKLLITSRIGGIPEQVENCEGVFLFDAGEDGQLV